MRKKFDVQLVDWRLPLYVLCLVIVPYYVSKSVASESYKMLLLFAFLGGVIVLYLKQFELFILFALFINHNIFYLLPAESLGKYSYASLSLIVLFPTLAAAFIFWMEKRDAAKSFFGHFIIAFMIILTIGIFKSYSAGQPIAMGIKKAIFAYGPILFYFVFLSRKINVRRFLNFMIVLAVCLGVLNNIQYVFYGKVTIFWVFSELVRAGYLRYLIGGFFLIFSALAALNQYLAGRGKTYLLAFVYLVGTIVLQGQSRAIIWGFLAATLFALFIAKRIDLKKVLLFGVPIIVLLLVVLPYLQSGRWGEFYSLTRQEIVNREGNWGGRIEAYNHYFHDALKSPLIGSGIWNELYDISMGNNPEIRGPEGFGLPDVGIMALLFRFGLAGGGWFLLLILKGFRLISPEFGQMKNPLAHLVGSYFFFGLSTLLTIDCFTQQEVIIYLALSLALIDRASGSLPAEEI
jgi:hypothetical protein